MSKTSENKNIEKIGDESSNKNNFWLDDSSSDEGEFIYNDNGDLIGMIDKLEFESLSDPNYAKWILKNPKKNDSILIKLAKERLGIKKKRNKNK